MRGLYHKHLKNQYLWLIIAKGVFVYSRLTKGSDTVGHPPNAKNSASHMLSLKVQKSQESNAITVAVSRENRMTNNIWAFSEPRGLMYFFISEVL